MLELAQAVGPAVRGLAATFDALPGWAAALLFAAPILVALLVRSGAALLAAALLSLAALALALAGPVLTLSGLGAGLALTGAFAAAAAGLGARERRAREAEIEQRLDHVHRQMTVFLEALDRRQSEVDKMREEARTTAETLRKFAAAQATVTERVPPPPPAALPNVQVQATQPAALPPSIQANPPQKP